MSMLKTIQRSIHSNGTFLNSCSTFSSISKNNCQSFSSFCSNGVFRQSLNRPIRRRPSTTSSHSTNFVPFKQFSFSFSNNYDCNFTLVLKQNKRHFSTSNNNNNNNSNDSSNEKSNSQKNNDNKSDKSGTNRATILREQRLRLQREQSEKNQALALKFGALVVFVLAASYAFVPLYQAFCQATGYGGTVQQGKKTEEMLASSKDKPKKKVTITFNADVSPHLPWTFVPSQTSIECETGDTVLAFYRATNKSDQPVVGISTYNVTPMKAGLYFHKIQCFCFDEQRLRPHETVEMPVFFYVDPDIALDKNTANIDHLVLSYTFFLVQEGGEPELAFEKAAQPV